MTVVDTKTFSSFMSGPQRKKQNMTIFMQHTNAIFMRETEQKGQESSEINYSFPIYLAFC